MLGMYISRPKDADGNYMKKEVVNNEVSLLRICSDTKNLDLIDTETMQEVIDFKWTEFGFAHHLIGLMFHACQMGLFLYYVNHVYIHNDLYDYKTKTFKENNIALLLLICLVYPTIYEIVNMYR